MSTPNIIETVLSKVDDIDSMYRKAGVGKGAEYLFTGGLSLDDRKTLLESIKSGETVGDIKKALSTAHFTDDEIRA